MVEIPNALPKQLLMHYALSGVWTSKQSFVV